MGGSPRTQSGGACVQVCETETQTMLEVGGQGEEPLGGVMSGCSSPGDKERSSWGNQVRLSSSLPSPRSSLLSARELSSMFSRESACWRESSESARAGSRLCSGNSQGLK